MKSQPTEGETAFAYRLSDKGLVLGDSKKPTIQQKDKQANWKDGKGCEKTSFREDLQMAKKYT